MAKNRERNEGRKEGILVKTGKYLRKRLKASQKASFILLVLMLLAVITGIVGGYLYTPAKEIYVAESTFHKETRSIYDYAKDSSEREAQIAKADEAEEVFANVMNKYTTDSNGLIKGYAGIHSTFVKLIIAFGIVLPYLAIAIVFVGSPTGFLFAMANIFLVAPYKAICYLFNSLRENKKSKRPSKKHLELKEAAN